MLIWIFTTLRTNFYYSIARSLLQSLSSFLFFSFGGSILKSRSSLSLCFHRFLPPMVRQHTRYQMHLRLVHFIYIWDCSQWAFFSSFAHIMRRIFQHITLSNLWGCGTIMPATSMDTCNFFLRRTLVIISTPSDRLWILPFEPSRLLDETSSVLARVPCCPSHQV